jgi:hypothetical protein
MIEEETNIEETKDNRETQRKVGLQTQRDKKGATGYSNSCTDIFLIFSCKQLHVDNL